MSSKGLAEIIQYTNDVENVNDSLYIMDEIEGNYEFDDRYIYYYSN